MGKSYIIVGKYFLQLGVKMIRPFLFFAAGFIKGDKEGLRRVYIRVNNFVVKQELKKKTSVKLLVLLPHCMQSKDCSCKITEDIRNCNGCGSCNIGAAAEILEGKGIQAVVAKGGTAARNTLKELRPDLVLAVACERELLSGIIDAGKIPVIGIINQRPNGYCTNTTVDMEQLTRTLKELIKEDERVLSPSCCIHEESPTSSP